jgi:glutathione synthase/RimK-type ligase-like ATP-grasp enzyme
VQLRVAAQAGFRIPQTVVTNSGAAAVAAAAGREHVVLKSLDTLLVREAGVEAFAYSVPLQAASLAQSDMRAAPAILQEYLEPKVDLRVTVVGEHVYCARGQPPDSPRDHGRAG